MPDYTQELILDEVRALRADFNNYARETGERVATLESHVHGLVGNGQPGRMALLEAAVEKLSQWRWWLVGVAAGSTSVVGVLAWVVTEMKK
jgi:hypothetical protein